MADAYLILENGTVFKGQPFGFENEAIGELVFSTGMTGYMETLTDPRHHGHIVIQTFPLIGNYGVIPDEMRSPETHLKAYICSEWCQEPSNFRNEGNLGAFMRENKVPGISGIDTRALTRIIRDNGTMNAMVSRSPDNGAAILAAISSHKIENAVAACTEKSHGVGSSRGVRDAAPYGDFRNVNNFHVAVWDFGDADVIARDLGNLGCAPFIFRHDSNAQDFSSRMPDGVILSDGPDAEVCNAAYSAAGGLGEITANGAAGSLGGITANGAAGSLGGIIREIEKLCNLDIPILGIGLGHQLLALARGAKMQKLAFGHRGANQPVRETATGRLSITKQNHGCAVLLDALPQNAAASYVNLNDGTCEGIEYFDIPAISVQFDPTDDIYDRFTRLMKEKS
ncbi:MAG: carbamoyl phosphate synthase small subunit [Oscillospiraceae bacterium]|nr:carbamoyl phosphate synthase small subunit [Oscillospiraceae bacterium]